jgi:WD40 repeat protein
VHGVAWSVDGRTLASVAWNGVLCLWDATRKENITLSRTVPMDDASGIDTLYPLASVGFSPDGKYLAVSGFDGNTRLWDVSTPGHFPSAPFAILAGETNYITRMR